LAFAGALSVITYLHRVCISGAAPAITRDLGLTPIQMGYVFSAFVVGYTTLQVPAGLLGDRLGPRRVLACIVFAWSGFTAFTGAVRTLGMLVAIRFLFGAAQAGAFPVTTASFSRWFPPVQVGFAQGFMWMSARLGGALAPGLIVLMIAQMGWRTPFMMFGVLGAVWALFFYAWYRDRPQEKRGVNEAELEIIHGSQPSRARQTESGSSNVPWKKFLRSQNLWAICLMYFCLAFGWFFYVTWLPTYLRSRGMTLVAAGVYSGLPLFLGAFGCILGGRLTDYVVRRTGSLRSRCYIGFGGFAAGALCLLASAFAPDARTAVLLMALASFFGDVPLSSCWAVCIDIGRRLAGTVSGCMNTWGSLGAMLSPVMAGYVVQHFGAWRLAIICNAVVLFLGALLWLRIDPRKPLLE
jgi:sugar phosphate permease